eukprot:CAMPEP_0170534300 /NCGR_PEP_ID=MMETSP0209-20121228/90139_1 /TAXON_ID=665100 ORGANISM="Litonotus pictus, Strain P1" /NCGR_SAMPLE_ID=MMETSP0209 /ASSEMBLY_ACC=CAM_ASM_000301 /LENGTH=257 /DNA_ID=CAMNT_0010833455 /DNA_START=14 /DNA_END=784 /DNA_ORIENTATION=+
MNYSVDLLKANEQDLRVRLNYGRNDLKNFKSKGFSQELIVQKKDGEMKQEGIIRTEPVLKNSEIVRKFYLSDKNLTINFTVEGEKKLERIHFYKNSNLIHTINLEDHKVNKVYLDDNFGPPKVNSSGNKIVFIAEEKKEHLKRTDFSFNVSKAEKEIQMKDNEGMEKIGEQEKQESEERKKEDPFNKYDYEQGFGEGFDDHFTATMFLLDFSEVEFNKYSLKKVSLDKLSQATYENENLKVYPGTPIFDYNDNIVFV